MNLTIVQICLGVGLLALPYAFCLAGFYLGIVGVLFVALCNAANSAWLQECKYAMIRARAYGPPGALSSGTFGYVARVALGERGPVIVDVSILVTLMGCSVLYLITLGHLLPPMFAPLLSSEPGSWGLLFQSFLGNPTAVIIAITVLLTPTILAHDLTSLTFVSLFGVTSYVIAMIIVVTSALSQMTVPFWHTLINSPLWALPPGPLVHSLVQFTGMVAFSYGVPVLTFDLDEAMAKPARLPRALYTASLVVGSLYCLVGLTLVVAFADPSSTTAAATQGIQPFILMNLPQGSAVMGFIGLGLMFTMLCSLPVTQLIPSANLLETLVFGPKSGSSTTSCSSSNSNNDNEGEDDEDGSAAHLRRPADEEAPLLASSGAPKALYTVSHAPVSTATVDVTATDSFVDKDEQRRGSGDAYGYFVDGFTSGSSGNGMAATPLTATPSNSSSSAASSSSTSSPSSNSSASSVAQLPPSVLATAFAVVSFPLTCLRRCLALVFISSTARSTTSTFVSKVVLRVLSVWICALVAIKVPCFSLVMSFVGSGTMGLLCFIFPAVFILIFAKKQYLVLSPFKSVCVHGMLVFGILAVASSFYIATNGTC